MDEYIWKLGPISFLRAGAIWALDIGPVGIFGIGWRKIACRRGGQ